MFKNQQAYLTETKLEGDGRLKNKNKSEANDNKPYTAHEDAHKDEDSIDYDYTVKDYPIMEHMSNARLMPMTGPYGRLDLFDTYEYAGVPEDPETPMEPYDVIMDKNTQKPPQ